MGFYFVGREDNPLFLVHNTLAGLHPRLASLGIKDFEYSGTSPSWDMALAEVFADKSPQKFTQLVYTNPNLKDTMLPEMEDSECRVKEITLELLHRGGLDTFSPGRFSWSGGTPWICFAHGAQDFVCSKPDKLSPCAIPVL